MSLVYIYTLSCPITGTIKYVGKATNLRLRYNCHISDRRKMNKVRSWIRGLLKNNLLPVMEVIDICSNDDWRFWESYWICQLKAWSFPLKNMIDGGIGIARVGQEMRDKISKALLGRKPSPNARLNTIKPVCKYDLMGNYIEKYESITETGLIVNNIISAIQRKQSSYGFQWRYYSDSYLDNIGQYKRNRGKSTKRGRYKKSGLTIDKTTLNK